MNSKYFYILLREILYTNGFRLYYGFEKKIINNKRYLIAMNISGTSQLLFDVTNIEGLEFNEKECLKFLNYDEMLNDTGYVPADFNPPNFDDEIWDLHLQGSRAYFDNTLLSSMFIGNNEYREFKLLYDDSILYFRYMLDDIPVYGALAPRIYENTCGFAEKLVLDGDDGYGLD